MHSSCDVVVGNMDLMTEILLRLPAKHVLRSKCVCKKWLALISDPQFCYSHALRLCHNPYPRALLLQKLDDVCDMKACIAPFSPSPKRIIHLDIQNDSHRLISSVMHSCNGLLLWSVYPSSVPPPYFRLEMKECFQGCSFYVCNPATSHRVHLDYPSDEFHPYSLMAYLAFEPLRSPYYKVVLFDKVVGLSLTDRHHGVHELLNPTIKISVYSSETGSWSEVKVCSSTPPDICVRNGVYCNGAIYWYTLGENSVYFDVHRLCFNKLPAGPASVDSNDVCVKYLGESGGSLHLILANSDENLVFDIWELKEDFSGWVVRYHVDLNLMAEGDAAFSWHVNPSFSVLCVVRQANEEESMLVLFVDSKIMFHNLKDHSSRILYEVDEMPKSFHQYFETLSCTGLDYN